jgi:hypothetical protein
VRERVDGKSFAQLGIWQAKDFHRIICATATFRHAGEHTRAAPVS